MSDETIDQIIAIALQRGALQEKLRISEAISSLGIPYVPVATIVRILEEGTNV